MSLENVIQELVEAIKAETAVRREFLAEIRALHTSAPATQETQVANPEPLKAECAEPVETCSADEAFKAIPVPPATPVVEPEKPEAECAEPMSDAEFNKAAIAAFTRMKATLGAAVSTKVLLEALKPFGVKVAGDVAPEDRRRFLDELLAIESANSNTAG